MCESTKIDLLVLNCKNYTKDEPTLSNNEINELLNQVPGWEITQTTDNSVADFIYKDFKFKDYYQTIAFMNAVAWVVHQQDHHPEITIHYNTCLIQYSTHSVKGLTLNDFICAARINHI